MLDKRRYSKYKFYEQYLRMIRYYEKLLKITKKRVYSPFTNNETDILYSFFINCYHLKDWIINDPFLGINSQIVEDYVNENDNLCICADICNGLKHLKLKRPRYQRDARLGKQVHTTIHRGDETLEERRFIVETGGKPSDGTYFAMNCIALWEQFVEQDIR